MYIPDFLNFLAAILDFWHYYLSDHDVIWYDYVSYHNKQLLFFMYIKNIYSFSDIPDFLYFLAAILDFWHYYLSDHAKIWYDNV